MRRALFSLLALAVLALLAPGAAFAADEQSLLTMGGTLHTITAGKAVDLGVGSQAKSPDDIVLEWTAVAGDGTVSSAIIPGTDSQAVKRGLQAAFDEQTQTLVLLWTEDSSGYTQVRVGVLRQGAWTNSGLLPTQGISKAYNPQMVITHQPVYHLDSNDQQVWTSRSTLSIIWWEEAQIGQARLATLALDENQFDPSNLDVYDLPALVGSTGPVSYEGVPSGAYLFPTLQADGLGGGLVAAFADLHDQLEKIVQISFPQDQGKPSDSANVSWKRRHIPIVGVAGEGGLAGMTPAYALNGWGDLTVGTSIGAGYRPTMYWHDGASLVYTHYDGTSWAPVRSIAIDDVTMTWDRATALVVGMGQRK
jgi:hypothetical protein